MRTEKPSTSNLTVARPILYTKPAKMENEKGEIVDLYVFPPSDSLSLQSIRCPVSCLPTFAVPH